MVDSSSGAMIPVVDANGSVALANIRKTMLNPNALEWCLENNRADEDERCLFITFSKWLPIVNEREITLFFNQMFGRTCVQSISFYQANIGDENQPLSAKVVFYFSYIPRAVLARANEVYFFVNAKSMWCKRYNPKKKPNQEGAI